MKNSLMTVVLFCTFIFQNSIAQVTDNTKWGNHRFNYTAKVSENKLELNGSAARGSDWGSISLLKSSDNQYKVTKDAITPDLGKVKAVYKSIDLNGKKQGILLFYNANNALVDLLLEGQNTTQLARKPYRYIMLGEFFAENGDHYIFTENSCSVNGKTYDYDFLDPESEDQGDNIFKLGNKYFSANITLDGLTLIEHKVTQRDYGTEIEELGETIDLKFVNSKPRFGFTENNLIIDKLYLPKNELRFVINEIFARHGRTFDSEDLKSYFSAKPWYKPLGDNTFIKLSDVEKLNVEILRGEQAN